jgi:hypothetical protein
LKEALICCKSQKFVKKKANISNNNNNHFIEKERFYFSMKLLNYKKKKKGLQQELRLEMKILGNKEKWVRTSVLFWLVFTDLMREMGRERRKKAKL